VKLRLFSHPNGSWEGVGGAEDHIGEENDSACSEEVQGKVVGSCHTGSKHHQATCCHGNQVTREQSPKQELYLQPTSVNGPPHSPQEQFHPIHRAIRDTH